ncbi:hypothetical protein C9374_008333 [Naegleria lovaniensis]|uniref:RapA2 cadherin-like domain-containing protein n=1 Tax=Naegleria lovaniensis TaxID=51637 RepID=A0AA88KFY2_NAELO|nr:uncharacterized protein C9374_008333 [Naegleria lovaniensis]KAG2378190.1 hypothetical protein C9374_008333 [Naegleria lovaniensis]
MCSLLIPSSHNQVGGVITALVIASTVATIILVSVGVGYSPPQPKNDMATTFKRVPITLDVLLNDVDPRGGNLTLTNIVVSPRHGVAKIISKSKIMYQSLGAFTGNDTFSYEVSNSFMTANATVIVQVLNRAPEAIPIVKTVPKNANRFLIDIFSYVGDNGERISDVDNDALYVDTFYGNQIVGGNQTDLGIVEKDTWSGFYYTPKKDFNGVEQFNYVISDGNDTSTSTITITIQNNPPTCVDDTFNVPKYGGANLDVLKNDNDINGDDFYISRALGAGYGGVSVRSNNKLVYYYTSSDLTTKYGDSFEYSITDGQLESSCVAFIQVYNTPPEVFSKTFTVGKSTTGNLIPIDYFDVDGKDLVTLKSISPALNTLNPAGSVQSSKTYKTKYFECCDFLNVEINNYTLVFSPTPGTVYSTVLSVTMTDGEAEGTGKITINVVNTPPTPVDDTASCGKNLQTLINVIENDFDTDNGDNVLLKLTSNGWITATEKGGSVSLYNNTHVLYTAPKDLVGTTDVAYYRVTDQSVDGNGQPDPTSFATGKITISLINNPPTPVDDVITIPKGIASVLNVLTNDVDPNDGPNSIKKIKSVDASANKNIVPSILLNQINGNTDAVSYTAVNEEYTDSFLYDVTDQDGMDSTFKAKVTLNVVNTAPVANNDNYNTKWNRSVDCNVKANDFDENGDLSRATVNIIANPGQGSVVVMGDVVRYTPNNGFVGTDSFTYRLNDLSSVNALSNIATVTIQVTNTAPVTQPDSISTHWRNPVGVLVSPLTNDNDPDGDALVVSDVSSSVGTATLVDSQTIKFIQARTHQLLLELNNSHTLSRITIYKLLCGPTSLSTKGSVVVTSGSGSVTYTPNKSYTGASDQFRYVINDGAENSVTQGTVTIQLTNNDKPTASDASYSVHWRVLQSAGGYRDFDVLSGKTTDSDGDSLSVSVVASGSCSVVSNKVRVTVTSGFIGTTSCSFTVTDGHDSVTKTASVVTFNTAPTCSDISVSFDPNNFNTGQTIVVTSFINDLDSADVAFLTPTEPAGVQAGDSLTVNSGDRTLLFKPAKTVGTRVMSYKVTDGVSTSAAFTVHWNSANNEIDIFAAIPTSTFSQIYPGYSAVSITYNSGNKKIYYTPKKAVGFDQFIVGVKDELNTPRNVTVSVTIYNNAPSASVPQSSVVWSSSGIDIDLLVAYSDADMTAGFETLGTVSSIDTATATDGVASTTFPVLVVVTNQAPVTQPKTVSITWSQHKAGYSINVLNFGGKVDSDPDGNALTASLSGGVSPSTAGSVSLTASPNAIVTAGANVYLGSFSFGYSASDSVTSTPGSVTVTVTNTLPSPSPYSLDLHWRSKNVALDPVISYAPTRKDSDGDSLTITAASASKGTAVANTNTITYTAPASLGLDVVSYTLTDGAQSVSNANTVVNVNVVNTNPIAAPLTASGKWSAVITKDLTTVSNAVGGTTSVSGNVVSFTSTLAASSYSLSGNVYTGTGSYKYTCTDGLGTSQGTVTVTVNNNAPTGTGNSVTLPRDYTKTTYDFTWAQMGTFSDADGDTISVIKVATTSDVTVTTIGSGIRLTTSQTVVGAKAITFKLFDGLHESVNTLTFTVTFTNAAPTCSPALFEVNKGTATDMLPKLKTLIADANKDSLSVSLTGTLPVSLGSITGTTFTSSSTNSGTSTAVSYIVSDSQLQATCGMTLTVTNRAPTANPATYSFDAQAANFVHTAQYDQASDPDSADTLTYSMTSNTCGSIASSVSVSSSGLITFTRKSTSLKGTCTVLVNVVDSDGSNPLSASATVTLVLNSQTPTARDDRFSINQGQTIRIFVSQMLANDNDEFGGVSGLTFVNVSCPDASYCHKTPRIVNVNGQTAVELDSDTKSCQADKFRYTPRPHSILMYLPTFSLNSRIVIVNPRLISSSYWTLQDRLLAADAVQVGIVRFHTTGVWTLGLTTDGVLVNNTLTNMPYDAGSTAQVPGLRVAVNMASQGRTDADKVIYVLTDGMANVPCSCSQCESNVYGWAASPSMFKDTVQSKIIDNAALTADQKKAAYRDLCKYQYSDTNWAFSGKTCSYCTWDSNSYCLPCADAVPWAKKVGTWKRDAQGIVPNDPDNPFNGNNKVSWKIVAMAVGNAMSNPVGARQIQGMNYDPARAMTVSWNDLDKMMSEIVDQSCNTNDVQIGQ